MDHRPFHDDQMRELDVVGFDLGVIRIAAQEMKLLLLRSLKAIGSLALPKTWRKPGALDVSNGPETYQGGIEKD